MIQLFDTVAIVDWSSRGVPSPRELSPDALWIGVAGAGEHYFQTRHAATQWLAEFLSGERAAERRALVGFDFPFGYPRGFAPALTGCADALAVWELLAGLIDDAGNNRNNRFAVAAELNARLPSTGMFWGNALAEDFEHLPRKKPVSLSALHERRIVERSPYAKSAKSCWQLSGRGSVGGQVLSGLPALWRLREKFGASVWPFDTGLAALGAPLVLAEVYPSLLADVIRAEAGENDIPDRIQVRVTARAFAALDAVGGLALLFEGADSLTPDQRAVVAREEGWILGAGHEAALRDAARPPPPSGERSSLPPGVDWVPADVALARLRDRMQPVAGTETVPVAEAGGRILAGPVTARRSHPPAANAAVDGYGFAHAALGPGGCLSLVQGRAAAGAPYPGSVPPGSAVRILTGALLPDGVDTVVLDEAATVADGAVRIAGRVKPRSNTRAAGEDREAGAALLAGGRILGPQEIALAVIAGLPALKVRRPLRVAVLSTGDEIVPTGSDAAAHQTYDANRPMLVEMLRRWGMTPVALGLVPDRLGAVAAALDRGAAEADAILTTGGASAGDEDHVARLLKQRGNLETWRIAVKPGRPLALGAWGGAPVFGLPGNPVAAFVCALIFARPALLRLAGAPWQSPAGVLVPAAFEKAKHPGRREYLRARLDPEGRAEVFPSEGSGRVSGLAWARGLVELEDAARRVRPGDPVRYLAFAEFGL